MNIFKHRKPAEQTLRRRLIRYMLVLTSVVLVVLLSTLSLFGAFRTDRQNLMDSLDLQLHFMETDLLSHGVTLAAMGVDLSNTTAALLEERLQQSGLELSDLEGNTQVLSEIQEELIVPLREALFRSESSGAFIFLNTTVYTKHDPGSHTGLYLQTRGTSPTDDTLLLYRGKADVGKALGIMPHRKWRLEFQTNLFSYFDPDALAESIEAEWAYTYSPVLTLPGTSEKALLLQVPILGSDGTLYGICGFEINQSFFKTHYTQPSKLEHLAFLLFTQNESRDIPDNRLTSGTVEGYYSAPTGSLEQKALPGPANKFMGKTRSYAGITRQLALGPNNPDSSLAVLMPLEEYRHILVSSLVRTVLLTLVLLVFAIICCALFSQRFLLPILQSLEQVRKGNTEQTGLQEIDDLLGFLAEQDELHQNTLRTLEDKMLDAQSRAALIRQEYNQIYNEYRSAQKEVSRLADVQLMGVDSAAYREFLDGIQELTPTETTIFQYYLEGKTVKEIMAITQTKESTLRYHNHNIYGKLGVKSLKQLLQFATIMQAQNRDN